MGEIWEEWFGPFFAFIHENADVIRTVAYMTLLAASLPVPDLIGEGICQRNGSFLLRQSAEPVPDSDPVPRVEARLLTSVGLRPRVGVCDHQKKQ